jgi:hypothetical protein
MANMTLLSPELIRFDFSKYSSRRVAICLDIFLNNNRIELIEIAMVSADMTMYAIFQYSDRLIAVPSQKSPTAWG